LTLTGKSVLLSIIIAADDGIEPIIAFSDHGVYQRTAANPLACLLERDLPARKQALAAAAQRPVRRAYGAAPTMPEDLHGKHWQHLVDRALKAGFQARDPLPNWTKKTTLITSQDDQAYGTESVSDVHVSPLLQSQWSQSTAQEQLCYNYYTPNNYVCGCVATAMAQLMRYFQFPVSGIGQITNLVKVDSSWQENTTRGGDGSGGPYVWTNMPLVPASAGYNEAQWQMIGSLCYDAGVAVSMQYTAGSSGAWMDDAASALTNVFQYSNVVHTTGSSYLLPINANLQSGLPVLLGIYTSGGDGHAIVCDGYGYTGGTLYHHLNLGWAGSYDAYYNLPVIDTFVTFSIIDSVTSHVFTNRTGEIISGRILDISGAPLGGATVTAQPQGGDAVSAVTGTNGYYGIIGVPLNSTNTVTVSASGYPSSGLFDVKVGNSGGAVYGCIADADLTISSNQPVLSCYPTTLSQIITNGGLAPVNQSYEIWNSGIATANYTIATGAVWLAVNPSTGTSTGEHDTIQVSYTNTESLAPGTYTASITNTAPGAGGSPKTIAVTLRVRCEVNVAIDQPTWVITNGGDTAWFGQGDTAHDGISAAQSDPIDGNQQAWFQTTVAGSGTLGFWWKVSSETNYDYLRFYMNGSEQSAISGETGWQQKTYILATGIHTLKWSYIKDPFVQDGSDAGWVDQVTFITNTILVCSPTNLAQTITEGQNGTNQTYALCNAGGGSMSYTITENADWLTVTPASGASTGEHDTIVVGYQTADLSAGVYAAIITNTAAGAEGSPRLIAVSLTVDAAPFAPAILTCSPTNLAQTITEGQNGTNQTYALWNAGGGSMSYTITENADWLTVTPASGASTGEHDTIVVSYQTAGLSAGIYTAVLTNTAPEAESSPATIQATLTVNALPATLEPPTGVSASDGTFTNKVRITWQAASNATAYEVWRSDAPDINPVVKLADTTALGYDDASAATIPGMSLYYRVKAKSSIATSEFSAPDTGYCALSTNVISGSAELVLSGLEVLPALIAPGAHPETIALVLMNNGPDFLAPPDTRINLDFYLSRNSIPGDSDDIWVGDYAADVTLASGQYLNGVIPPENVTIPTAATGSYYVFAKVRHAAPSTLTDPDERNNTAMRAGPIATELGDYYGIPASGNYDGDSKTDPALYQETTGLWAFWLSSADYALTLLNFGGSGYQPVPGDYDGDGKAEPALYSEATAEWFVMLSSRDYALSAFSLGAFGWMPVAADYDGDGITDPAGYHEATGTWLGLLSDSGVSASACLGGPGLRPAPGDYDGDGKADPAVFDSGSGYWFALLSGQDYALTSAQFPQYSAGEFQTVSGDYDGDRITDPALYETAGGKWQAMLSAGGFAAASLLDFGGTGYLPTPDDYDGDGKIDPALYHPASGTWQAQLSGDIR